MILIFLLPSIHDQIDLLQSKDAYEQNCAKPLWTVHALIITDRVM